MEYFLKKRVTAMRDPLMELVVNYYVKNLSDFNRKRNEDMPNTLFEYFYKLKSGKIEHTSDVRKVAGLKDKIESLLRTRIDCGRIVVERIDDNVVLTQDQIIQQIAGYYEELSSFKYGCDIKFFIENYGDFFYAADGMVKKIMNNYDRLFLKNNPRPIYLAFRIEKEIYIKKIEMKDWF